MTTFGATIVDADSQNPVRGDTLVISRTVSGVPMGDPLERAWLTVKKKAKDVDADAKILKEITTTEVVGTGEIEADGSIDGEAELRFDIGPDDYDLIVGGTEYVYDIQVRTAAGIISTQEIGTVTFVQDVTVATEAAP